MDVGPHPHIGLQTVIWLHEGEVVHQDSLGYESVLRPGGVNVMTSGDGIAHAEQTPRDNTGRLNGVQPWTAFLRYVWHRCTNPSTQWSVPRTNDDTRWEQAIRASARWQAFNHQTTYT